MIYGRPKQDETVLAIFIFLTYARLLATGEEKIHKFELQKVNTKTVSLQSLKQS